LTERDEKQRETESGSFEQKTKEKKKVSFFKILLTNFYHLEIKLVLQNSPTGDRFDKGFSY